MKISSIFHALIFFMTVLIVSMPVATLAQQNSLQAEAKAAAEVDANTDVNKPLWFGAGCLLTGLAFLPDPYGYFFPPIGVIGAYVYRPDPPVSRFIGKSPEYIAAYTSAYKAKRGNTQGLWAGAGCLTGGVVVGAALTGIIVGVLAAEAE